ncbi:MAG: hypothetical protein LUH05_03235 [Candidatus Gastranaerophilales bacterium]|nr:hypothetical protein [Candidatus Gastranaerophilales bacterium]
MCSTTGLNVASVATQALGTAASAYGSMQSAKSYRTYVQNQVNSTLDNYRYQSRALNNAYSEEMEQANQENHQAYLANLQSKAAAQASAASSGVEGSSLDSLFAGYDRASAISNYLTERNLRNKGLQYNDNLDSLRTSALSSLYGLSGYTNTTASTLLSGVGSLLSSPPTASVVSQFAGKSK